MTDKPATPTSILELIATFLAAIAQHHNAPPATRLYLGFREYAMLRDETLASTGVMLPDVPPPGSTIQGLEIIAIPPAYGASHFAIGSGPLFDNSTRCNCAKCQANRAEELRQKSGLESAPVGGSC
jgi:hypothetical protein